MTGRNERGEFTPGNEFASIGGGRGPRSSRRRGGPRLRGWAGRHLWRTGSAATRTRPAGGWAHRAHGPQSGPRSAAPRVSAVWEHPGPCPRWRWSNGSGGN